MRFILCKWAVCLLERELLYLALSSIVPTRSSPPNASKYFRIGENKLRRLAEENKDAGWLIMNGNRIQIKRRQFEKVIDKLDAI